MSRITQAAHPPALVAAVYILNLVYDYSCNVLNLVYVYELYTVYTVYTHTHVYILSRSEAT
jgi:hypothetical protein